MASRPICSTPGTSETRWWIIFGVLVLAFLWLNAISGSGTPFVVPEIFPGLFVAALLDE